MGETEDKAASGHVESPPPMAEQVREMLDACEPWVRDGLRVLLRHVALCPVEPFACPTCSATAEAVRSRM